MVNLSKIVKKSDKNRVIPRLIYFVNQLINEID